MFESMLFPWNGAPMLSIKSANDLVPETACCNKNKLDWVFKFQTYAAW